MPSRHARRASLTAALIALAAAPAAQASTAHHVTSAWDRQWLTSSISGDRFEVDGGRMAQRLGSAPAVKALGARLERDHLQSLHEAVRLAHHLGLSVPQKPTPSQEWELDSLRYFAGADFDRLYADLEVKDHRQDIRESRDEASDGTDPRVRALARKDLPVLRTHLRLSEAARRAVGG
ncbi:MAG: putative rane protein [Solirubrobacteraceae bacterium]|jgi:putative membrane protein|nr:putative rane protein [Solirubrobacteraceae bacterium]